MTDATAARLAAIGPYTTHRLSEDDCFITWEGLPALVTDWAAFDLEFTVEGLSDPGPVEPDDDMFELWEAYRPHHSAVAARVRADAERRLELFGHPGELASQVTSAQVAVYRSADDICEVVITVGLDCNEHGLMFAWDAATGELEGRA